MAAQLQDYLNQIALDAKQIQRALNNGEHPPDWVVNKLTTSAQRLNSANTFLNPSGFQASYKGGGIDVSAGYSTADMAAMSAIALGGLGVVIPEFMSSAIGLALLGGGLGYYGIKTVFTGHKGEIAQQNPAEEEGVILLLAGGLAWYMWNRSRQQQALNNEGWISWATGAGPGEGYFPDDWPVIGTRAEAAATAKETVITAGQAAGAGVREASPKLPEWLLPVTVGGIMLLGGYYIHRTT